MTQTQIIAELWQAVELYRLRQQREADMLILANAQSLRELNDYQKDHDDQLAGDWAR